jgi:hypothetical protein
VPDGNGWDASEDYDPLDPYDFSNYSENLWQTVLRAGSQAFALHPQGQDIGDPPLALDLRSAADPRLPAHRSPCLAGRFQPECH